MKINRYRAKSLKAAIDKARIDLGAEAKVIHVRQLDISTGNDVRDSMDNKVEIIAAIDNDTDSNEQLTPENEGYHQASRRKQQLEHSSEYISPFARNRTQKTQNQHITPEKPEAYKSYANHKDMLLKGDKVLHDKFSEEDIQEEDIQILRQEKQIWPKNEQDGHITSSVVKNNRSVLNLLNEFCSRNQVNNDIKYEILSLLNDDNMRSEFIRHPQMKSLSELDVSRAYLSFYINRQISMSGGLDISKKTVILIGPTGVGKTTTLAKLAAQYHFQKARSVGLITTDAYRIAAINQLKTYAQIMSIPLKVALTPEELERGIKEYRDMDIILVDTPGRSQFNSNALHELKGFLEAAQPADTHLLIAVSMKESDAYKVVENFIPQYVRQLIFTKLDETSNYGSILNICNKLGKPVSYLTTGQNVPDDIEVAQVDRIVNYFFDAGC